jgi:hypothetical protein
MLKCIGIECNYCNGILTGISLEKYRYIIRILHQELSVNVPQSYDGNLSNHVSGINVTISMYLYVIWTKAYTKSCLLDYIISFENASNHNIISPLWSDIRVANSEAQIKWLTSQSDMLNDDSTSHQVNNICTAMNDIITYLAGCNQYNDVTKTSHFLSQLEYMTVYFSLLNKYKASYILGKYKPSSKIAQVKSDCVEVVIREIIDYLIYGNN